MMKTRNRIRKMYKSLRLSKDAYLQAMDSGERWITVHPNGKEGSGRPALIDDKGIVKAGMGGKFNGRHISQAHKNGITEKEDGGEKEAKESHSGYEAYIESIEEKIEHPERFSKEDVDRARSLYTGPDTKKISAPSGHERLRRPLKIEKETEKAFLVDNPDFDIDEYSSHWNPSTLKGVNFWIPKSQVSVKNGYVVSAATWIARDKKLDTHEENERLLAREHKKEASMSAGLERYKALVQKAKAAGVPGIRDRMKTRTILEKMRAHGVSVDSMPICDRINKLRLLLA